MAARTLHARLRGDKLCPPYTAYANHRPMTKLLEQALRQVEQLSANDQDAAGAALIDYLAHRDDTRLSDEQLAEVRRRRADPNRKLVSHAEAKERLGRLSG